MMTLNSDDVLTIGFDEFSHNYHRLTCHLDHCEADWSVSQDIFESDWLQGFNDWQIEDYQNSINTTVLYTHYQLTIPNDRCQLKASGNYRLTIYDEDDADEKLLEVEFYVVEPLMTVGVEVTTNTDIDHNDSHQQLSFSLNYNDLRVTDLAEQLQTVVMQTGRNVTPVITSDQTISLHAVCYGNTIVNLSSMVATNTTSSKYWTSVTLRWA